jgi:hypothetical protein
VTSLKTSLKKTFHKTLYVIPGAEATWIGLNRAIGRFPSQVFSGWGMTTDTLPPWFGGGGDPLARDFVATHEDVIRRLRDGQFNLSQFADVADQPRLMRELMWRHFFVFWSARCAAQATPDDVKVLVECGVCDGLTIHFAMTSLNGRWPFRSYLFDAWEGMKSEFLLESEQRYANNYSYLAIDSTKRNLEAYAPHTIFVKGYIPESFATVALPESVAWLHIDLNASRPTQAVLETFYERMAPGGVMLFDDYGWQDQQATKAVIDAFATSRRGLLQPVPTGQALFFKPR